MWCCLRPSTSLRIIPLDGHPHLKNNRAWDGDSRGRWEGDTPVVDLTDLSDTICLDAPGHYHRDELHVVERYTREVPTR
jgi:hypothetical protein